VKGDYVTFRNGRITHGGGGNISPNRKPPVRWGDGLDVWGSAMAKLSTTAGIMKQVLDSIMA
jgi:hypothetical protein